jgi:hypothetical protein
MQRALLRSSPAGAIELAPQHFEVGAFEPERLRALQRLQRSATTLQRSATTLRNAVQPRCSPAPSSPSA